MARADAGGVCATDDVDAGNGGNACRARNFRDASDTCCACDTGNTADTGYASDTCDAFDTCDLVDGGNAARAGLVAGN
ncbi:MAG: hypothetical protein EOO38_04845 [Cytophagaceae bacterium]|nr:MAG: hypothetical protein EOO38_04845 [Cytophagaceae bacterium]